MFKVGDILKANIDKAEEQFGGARGTTVYTTMIELAKMHRFEVLGVDQFTYKLKRLVDGAQNTWTVQEVHENLVLAND
jgi:hypothetical protein